MERLFISSVDRSRSVRPDRWSGVVRIRPRDRGGLRSSRADSGPQVLPPARATVPPSLPAKSARVSNLPACCALGPPACAAPCSCHHEACSGRLAWLPLGRACLSAWIEHRSGEQRSPPPGPQGAPERAQSVRARAQEVHRSFLTVPRRRSLASPAVAPWSYVKPRAD
jgi:hypothetical protein